MTTKERHDQLWETEITLCDSRGKPMLTKKYGDMSFKTRSDIQKMHINGECRRIRPCPQCMEDSYFEEEFGETLRNVQPKNPWGFF